MAVDYTKKADNVVATTDNVMPQQLDKDELAVMVGIIGPVVDKQSISSFISVRTDGGPEPIRTVKESAIRDAWMIAKATVRIGREMA